MTTRALLGLLPTGTRVEGSVRFERPGRPAVVAVDDLSFRLPAGGSLAIVGESGSGKSTVARMLLALETPTSGRIRVAGRERGTGRSTAERRRQAKDMQIVFQNPYTSLDPRQRVGACLEERHAPVAPTPALGRPTPAGRHRQSARAGARHRGAR
jgi:oligopeptide transport system ATP-binding protein